MRRTILYYIILSSALTISFFANAQTEIDALKYLQTDITGTARYMSMAGAFGALGGDATAIKDNPAGLGIYRSHDLNTTLNLNFQSAQSKWGNERANDNLYKVWFNNLSYVIAVPTWKAEQNRTDGLLSSNFSLTFNRLKSFNRNITVKGGDMNVSLTDLMAFYANKQGNTEDELNDWNNEYAGWLAVAGYGGYLIEQPSGTNLWQSDFAPQRSVVPTYTLSERGYIDEYSFSWAGNFSNKFYLGLGVNVQAIDYSLYSDYREQSGQDYFRLHNEYTASGFSVNFNIGAIYKITDALRIGAALHTPTGLAITEQYYPRLEFDTEIYTGEVKSGTTAPDASAQNEYRLTSPFQANFSAAYVIGKKAIVSAEYVYNAYSSATFADSKGLKQNFIAENEGMKQMVNDGHTFKLGAEYRATANVSLRAGFATQNAIVSDKAEKLLRWNSLKTDAEYFLPNRINYYTCGVGYQENGWYIDFAYMHKATKQQFYPFNAAEMGRDLEPANITFGYNNIVATLGFRF